MKAEALSLFFQDLADFFFKIQKRPSLFAVFTSNSLNLHYTTDRSKTVPVSGLPAFPCKQIQFLVHCNDLYS